MALLSSVRLWLICQPSANGTSLKSSAFVRVTMSCCFKTMLAFEFDTATWVLIQGKGLDAYAIFAECDVLCGIGGKEGGFFGTCA